MNEQIASMRLCPVDVVMRMIGGKWKSAILWHLLREPLRFGELRKWLPEASPKILTARLRELEDYGLIERRVLSDKPFAVEYRIAEKGETLRAIIDDLSQWGISHVLSEEEREELQARWDEFQSGKGTLCTGDSIVTSS